MLFAMPRAASFATLCTSGRSRAKKPSLMTALVKVSAASSYRGGHRGIVNTTFSNGVLTPLAEDKPNCTGNTSQCRGSASYSMHFRFSVGADLRYDHLLRHPRAFQQERDKAWSLRTGLENTRVMQAAFCAPCGTDLLNPKFLTCVTHAVQVTKHSANTIFRVQDVRLTIQCTASAFLQQADVHD